MKTDTYNYKIFTNIAHRDALFYAVAVSTSVMELALFATSEKLGENALEIAFGLAIALAFIFENVSGYLVSGFAPFRMIGTGYLLKLLSVLALMAGFIASINDFPVFTSWMILLVYFVLDAIGSGILQVVFRPGYSQFYSNVTQDNSGLSFLTMFTKFRKTRIGVPVLSLTLVAVVYFFERDGFLPISISFVFIFGIMLILRTWQILSFAKDYSLFKKFDNKKTDPTTEHEARGNYQAKYLSYRSYWLMYVFANTLLLSVLAYMVGDAFRIAKLFLEAENLNWIIGSAVAITLHGTVVFGGSPFYDALMRNEARNTYIAVAVIFGISCLCVLMTLLWPALNIVVIVSFSFFILVCSNALVRVSSTILTNKPDHGSKEIFYAEFSTNTLMLILVGTKLYAPDLQVREVIYLSGAGLSGLFLLFLVRVKKNKTTGSVLPTYFE